MGSGRLHLNRLNILLVDDHQNMRRIWMRILKGFNITSVIEAECAAQALEILKDKSIDIAIIDLILPDLTGAELIGLVRRSEDSSDPLLPMIACTADTRKSVVYSLINAGVDEVLTKPVAPLAAWQRLQAVTTKRRDFIRTPDYFGPDRRRAKDPRYKGPDRRESHFI